MKAFSECYLLRLDLNLLNDAKDVASIKGMSLAALIRQTLSRNIVYHNKVEKPIYEEFVRGAKEAEPLTPFFSSEFGIIPPT